MFIAVTMLNSCKKSDIAYENDFDRSQKSWTSFKASSNNSYRYKVNGSSWTGSSSESVISVKDGKVTGRSFLSRTTTNKPGEVVVREEWIEDQSNINTHPGGYKAITLDEVYQKAKTEWLLKRKDADTYFETNNNGMISSCGYISKNCMDDCFRGITIESIEKI